MEIRRLQEMGGATLLVSIPKSWAKNSSLKKGSSVSLQESSDGGLLVYPVRSDDEEKTGHEIEIANPSRFGNERTSSEITAAYLLGYDLIRIKGQQRISSEDRQRITSALKRLIGLEIVEEDEKSITSQFLVDNTAVEPSKIFRRMSSLTRAMVSDTLRNASLGESMKVSSIAQRDDEVDRLHFLLVRLIRTAVRDPRVASRFGLSSIDCLDFRVATSSLEAAGDNAVELSSATSKLDEKAQEFRDLISDIAKLFEEIHDWTARSFLEKDFAIAQKVFQGCDSLEKILADLKSEDSSPATLHFVETLKRIIQCELDIADLVSPVIST
jgi:phosphate uptake regulator